jgi:adenine-specific DNA-methyltransferase
MPTLHFKGKPLVQNHHLVVPFSELEAVKSRGLSKMPSLHDNLIIEGDNLKALKALLPAYHGKVKCIYIDPPYNTGSEGWIYNDRVNSPMMRDWLGRTVDRDDLTRHDKWCCMMHPRLKLLRELLTDDGAIFVSIDDNEVHHLRALMDEVFGEENFVANFVWQSKDTPGNNAVGVAETHNHIVLYRNSAAFELNLLERNQSQLANYSNPDNDPRGDCLAAPLTRAEFRERDYYALKNKAGRKVFPPKGSSWRRPPAKMKWLQEDDRVWWGKGGDADFPMEKKFLKEAKEGVVNQSWWLYKFAGSTRNASAELKEIFGEKPFETPKPTLLVRRMLELIDDDDLVVLDATAGSGTTAHAVLALNKEDGGNRRFILCQMPFETKEQEQNKENICERITAERVRRVIEGVPNAKEEALRAGLGGTFSYFRLGKELRKQAILDGEDLPSYEALDGYVFFTATGEEFEPKKMKPPFIGASRERDVFLIYEQDIEKLKDMALNLDLARSIAKRSDHKKLIFAPTKYLDQDYLDRLGIEFCQLPFEIYQRAQK